MFGAVPPPKCRYFDTAVFCSTFERFFFWTNLILGQETESYYDREGNNNNSDVSRDCLHLPIKYYWLLNI